MSSESDSNIRSRPSKITRPPKSPPSARTNNPMSSIFKTFEKIVHKKPSLPDYKKSPSLDSSPSNGMPTDIPTRLEKCYDPMNSLSELDIDEKNSKIDVYSEKFTRLRLNTTFSDSIVQKFCSRVPEDRFA